MATKRKGEGTKFQIDRKFFTSDIWLSGSIWKLRLFIWLIGHVNIEPHQWQGILIKRGQIVHSYRSIAEEIAYTKGYVVYKPSISQVSRLFQELIKENRVKRNPLPALKNKDKNLKQRMQQTGYLITLVNFNALQGFTPYVRESIGTELKNDKTIYSLFEFWNSLKLIKHKKIDKFAPSLKTALKDYPGTQVRKAMVNYATVVKDKKYFFSYRWTLKEFLTRVNGLEKFLDINMPLENFLVDKNDNKREKEYPKYDDKT